MCCSSTPRPALQRHCSRVSQPDTSVTNVFTFEHIPDSNTRSRAPAPLSSHRHKSQHPRKRVRRVLYPRRVKKYLPAEQKDMAKRALFLLLTIVFYQVCDNTETYPKEVVVQTTAAQTQLPKYRMHMEQQHQKGLEANISCQEIQTLPSVQIPFKFTRVLSVNQEA
ncbi:radiation-inducible immediate-early gene IEX-1-like [Protopterus annectens]|uniref:radiation-inducible immediate-early gene IEX-1-like n=1 Tax=Protopterus annectens TaxID=7888 RepID=UPI001CFC466B|nr:radiation-inducible immediate-early gene IEX-1-like [Protopterus annectens]